MQTVLLVLHLLIAAALVGVVLLQRSEGGGLGMGGGSSGGGFMTGRGTANLLTRTTAILAGAFFLTSILLTILAQNTSRPGSILDRLNQSLPARGGPVLPATADPKGTGALELPPLAPVQPPAPAATETTPAAPVTPAIPPTPESSTPRSR